MGTCTFAMTNPPGSQQTGDVLVLTTTLRENGAPIWAVIALTLEVIAISAPPRRRVARRG